MPRQPSVVYEDVARAATRLIVRGKQITLDALYDEVGRRGSRTTLHKHYTTFLETFSNQGLTMLPSAMPEALIPLVEDFWGQALLAAGEGFESERADFERRVSELANAVKTRNERIQQLETLLDERETLLAQKSQQLDTKDREIADLERFIDGKDAQLAELKRDKQGLENRLAEERVHWSERFDAAKTDWDSLRGQLEHDMARTREKMDADAATHERLVDHWMQQLDDARQHISDLKMRHHEDLERLQGDIRLEKARADRFAANQTKMENRIESLETETRQREQRAKEVQEALESSEDARQLLENERDELIRENERLAQDNEQLRGSESH